MPRRSRRAELLRDARLTDSARIVGLYIEDLGVGGHEITNEEFAKVLYGEPSNAKIGRAKRALRTHGYIEQRPGGRDHADVYTFRYSADGDLTPNNPSTRDHLINDRLSPEDSLKDSSSAVFQLNEAHAWPAYSDAAVEVDGVDDERNTRRSGVTRQATDALRRNADVLGECRDALRDYVEQRVSSERQQAYIEVVAGWLSGNEPYFWKIRGDGGVVESGFRSGLVRSALNDLRASGELTMKRPEGDVGNLRTKVRYLLTRPSETSTHRGSTRPVARSHIERGDGRRHSVGDSPEEVRLLRARAWEAEHPAEAETLWVQAEQVVSRSHGHLTGHRHQAEVKRRWLESVDALLTTSGQAKGLARLAITPPRRSNPTQETRRKE